MFEEEPEERWAILFKPISIGYVHSIGLDHDEIREAVNRHKKGDWGECTEAEKEANAASLEYGGCVVSMFRDDHNAKFCVLTKRVTSDRPRTQVLSYKEYTARAR